MGKNGGFHPNMRERIDEPDLGENLNLGINASGLVGLLSKFNHFGKRIWIENS